MKTIKKNLGIKLVLFLFLIGGITSCDVGSDSNSGPVYLYVATTGVSGPVTAAVNVEISLDVTFQVTSNCGTFHSFYEEGTVAERTITVLAQYDTAADCDKTAVTRVAPYKFRSAVPGTYVLKFRVNNGTTSDSFITKTIVVT